MKSADEWFDKLYIENSPRMVKLAAYLLRNRQVAEELVDESFLILLRKKQNLKDHPNLPGWLSQTLKNLINDELKSARHRLELPMEPEMDIPISNAYVLPLSETLPKELKPNESEILILYYEKQLSYEQISAHLGISILNCRTRMFRAKAHYKKLINIDKEDSIIL